MKHWIPQPGGGRKLSFPAVKKHAVYLRGHGFSIHGIRQILLPWAHKRDVDEALESFRPRKKDAAPIAQLLPGALDLFEREGVGDKRVQDP